MEIRNVIEELSKSEEGQFLEVFDFSGESFGTCSISGLSPVWEIHPDTDEFFPGRPTAWSASAGAVVTKRARRTDWGGYAGYFSDPDAYLWEVAHNLLFWVGPSDESA